MTSTILASATPFIALCALACPLSMGVMMWMMMRSGRSQDSTPPAAQPSSLDELRREHERIGAQIESIEHPPVNAGQDAPTATTPRKVGV